MSGRIERDEVRQWAQRVLVGGARSRSEASATEWHCRRRVAPRVALRRHWPARAGASRVLPVGDAGRALPSAALGGCGGLCRGGGGGVQLLGRCGGGGGGDGAGGRAVEGGEWLGTEGFYRAPLDAYALACVKVVLGDHVGVTRLVQAVWGALGTVALAVGTARLLGRRCGIVAGLMLAVYPTAIFFDGLIQKTSLGCAGVCVLLAAMAEYQHRRSRRWAGCIGIVGGLVILTRENALVWAPLLAIWIPGTLGAGRKERWSAHVGSYVLGLLFVLGPVAVRNAVVCGDWSISTFQAGPNFYIGNHAGASGRYAPLVPGHETPVFERADATLIAERAEGQALSPQEVSHYWMRRAIQDIRAEPAEWVRLVARKVLMVWNRYEVSDVESEYVYRDYSVFGKHLGSVWHFGGFVPAGGLGGGIPSTAPARRKLFRTDLRSR